VEVVREEKEVEEEEEEDDEEEEEEEEEDKDEDEEEGEEEEEEEEACPTHVVEVAGELLAGHAEHVLGGAAGELDVAAGGLALAPHVHHLRVGTTGIPLATSCHGM
jgi:hypothetical protein